MIQKRVDLFAFGIEPAAFRRWQDLVSSNVSSEARDFVFTRFAQGAGVIVAIQNAQLPSVRGVISNSRLLLTTGRVELLLILR